MTGNRFWVYLPVRIEAERVSQSHEGVWPGSSVDTPFKIADPTDAEPGPLRELLLGQTASKPHLAMSALVPCCASHWCWCWCPGVGACCASRLP